MDALMMWLFIRYSVSVSMYFSVSFSIQYRICIQWQTNVQITTKKNNHNLMAVSVQKLPMNETIQISI